MVVAVIHISSDRVDLITSAHVEAVFGLAVLVVERQVEGILDESVYKGSDPDFDVQSNEGRMQIECLRASNKEVNLLNKGVLLDLTIVMNW